MVESIRIRIEDTDLPVCATCGAVLYPVRNQHDGHIERRLCPHCDHDALEALYESGELMW